MLVPRAVVLLVITCLRLSLITPASDMVSMRFAAEVEWEIQSDIPRIFGLFAEAERAVSRVSTAKRRRSRP